MNATWKTQNVNLGSFAVDTRIWQSLSTSHSPQHLQTVIDQIYAWVEDNDMLFNRDKFEFLNFAKSARTFYYEAPQQKGIEAKEGVRDLGIIFEPK